MDADTYSFIYDVKDHLNKISKKINTSYFASDKSFLDKYKIFDFCNDYSLIVSSECNIRGCFNSQSVFVIIGQAIINESNFFSNTHELHVYIRCFYLDSDHVLTHYTFTVTINSKNKIEQYINRISVNSNGSVILLHSKDSVYLFTTPEIIHNKLISNHFEYGVIIDEHIKCQTILSPDESAFTNIVKLEWSNAYSNSFMIATNHVENHKYSFENFEANINSNEDFYSKIVIYNIDLGIDEPVYTFKLTESQLRLGKDKFKNDDMKFQTSMGQLTDVQWDSSYNSDLGTFTLYALSNYGFLFCYCPIVLNKNKDLMTNLNLIKKCSELLNQGYSVGRMYNPDSSYYRRSKIQNSQSCKQSRFNELVESVLGEGEKSEPLPTVISLISDDEVPDLQMIYTYELFSSFSVLAEPFQIVALKMNQEVVIYEGDYVVNPKTRTFFNPGEMNKLLELRQTKRTELQNKSQYNFHKLTNTDFIIYSSSTVYHAKYDYSFKIKKVFETFFGSESQFFSQPIFIKTYSEKTLKTNNGMKTNPNKPNPSHETTECSIIFLNKIFLNRKLNKLDFLLHRIIHTKMELPKNDLTQFSLVSFDIKVRKSTNEIPIVFKSQIFQKIYESKEKVNTYDEYFTKLRKLNESTDLNEKAVEMIENLSELTSVILTHLDLQPVYQQAIDDYLNRNEDAVKIIDEYFKNALDDYHALFNKMKERVDKINENNDVIKKRRDEIINMAQLLINVKEKEESITYVSNMISEFYLRFSNIIVTKIADNIRESEYEPSYESRKQRMIDEWFHDTFRENVGMMHKIFNQIKTIRAGLDSIA